VRQQREELILTPVCEPQRLLALLQPLLCQLALRDIACDLRGSDDRSIGGPDWRYRERDGDAPAVLGDANGVEVIDALAAPQLIQDLLLFGVELGRYDDRDRFANHLARLIAEDACGAAVPREDAAFERLADDRIVR
jgi:hypothetical protein